MWEYKSHWKSIILSMKKINSQRLLSRPAHFSPSLSLSLFALLSFFFSPTPPFRGIVPVDYVLHTNYFLRTLSSTTFSTAPPKNLRERGREGNSVVVVWTRELWQQTRGRETESEGDLRNHANESFSNDIFLLHTFSKHGVRTTDSKTF